MADLNLPEILEQQYRASLEMFAQAVAKCPERLWLADDCRNRFWHVAYHAIFYTHLYLHPTEREFRPSERHRPNYQYLGATPWPPHERPVIDLPYTPHEILEYRDLCLQVVGACVRSPDLDGPSGFPWLPFSRMELHLYNIRHLQHHVGQLIDRVRNADDIAVPWVVRV